MASKPIAGWIPGSQLRAADKTHALRIFSHRRPGDAREWLNSHYFAIRSDGGLDQRVHTFRTLRDVLSEVRP